MIPRGLCPLAFALVCACAEEASAPVRIAPRSVVIYLVDTLRADHLGCYGYERETSPNLDRFAAEGVLFDHCLAQSTWTKPASASVLTGLFPSQHGMLAEESVLPGDATTLAERMKRAGLATGAFVSNQQVSRVKAELLRGFDEHRGLYNPGGDPPYMRAEGIVDASLEWIEAQGEAPFFCYIHTVDPHPPYQPPSPFDELFVEPGASEIDGSFVLHSSVAKCAELNDADVQRLIDLYDGEIAYTDQEFERFLDGLERMGRTADTLVVFLADHGEAFSEHDTWGHNPFMYKEVVRVPLLFRFPPDSGFSTGHRADVSAQVDLAPTLLSVMGLPLDASLPGRNLFAAPDEREIPPAFSEVEGGISRKALVVSGHKYIRQWSPVARELLFDLEADPGEASDLSGTEAVEAFRGILDAFIAETSSGYSLLFQNGGTDWMVVDCRIEAAAPFGTVKLFYADDKARHGEKRDGPPVVGFEDGVAWVECRFHVKTKDGDGLRFEPGEGVDELTITVTIDGVELDPGFVRLGSAGSTLEALPWELDLAAGPDLAAPSPTARGPIGGDPYRVTLWRPLSVETETAELSEDDEAALRTLGYLG